MSKKRGKIGKYSKISLQKKFQLLRLTQFGKNNLRDTSKNLEINYSTAKTICFQYQNHKIDQKLKFFMKNNINLTFQEKIPQISQTASYKCKMISPNKCKQISLVCTNENTLFDSQQAKQNVSTKNGISNESNKVFVSASQIINIKGQKYQQKQLFTRFNCTICVYLGFQNISRSQQAVRNNLEYQLSLQSKEQFKNEETLIVQNYANWNKLMCYFRTLQYPSKFYASWH